MATIISNEPDHGDEATMNQLSYIHNLLERRRVSGVCAAKIIALLNEEPELGASGLDNLKNLQRPS